MMSTSLFLIVLLSTVTNLLDGYLIQSKYLHSNVKPSSFQVRSVAASPNSVENLESIADLLLQFDLTVQDEDCDTQRASRLHLDLILTLVKSDVQNRDDDDGSESHVFPQSYIDALAFIVDQTASLKEEGSPLFASANMISKKEGLSQVIRSVKSVKKQLMSSREIVEVKRKTERVLSQLMTLTIAYRCCVQSGTANDFIFFTKALLEKTPIHDRHFALLLFGRGLLAPPYSKANSYTREGAIREPLIDVNSVIRDPVLGLSLSFKKSMAQLGVSQPSVSARILYPFAAAAMRAFNSESKPASGNKKDADWFSNDVSESQDLKSEKKTGVTDVDLKLARLLLACINEDVQAEKQRAMIGSGDEVLSTLRRWICDLAATHFMNDEEGLFSTRDSLPEEVKKNTVAMELLCTERAFCDGKKRDRARFLTLFVEIGNYLEVMMSLLDAKTSEGTVAVSNALTTRPKFTFHVKKTIAAISATKFLPRTHKLRVGMENGGANSFVGAFNADRKRKAGLVLRGSKMTAVESEGGESGSEDSMWAESKPTKSVKALKTVYISKRVAESESEEDDDMWAKKSGIQREREKEKKVRETAEGTNLKKDFDLIEQVDEYLLQILAEVLKVEESVLQQAHVREEVDYVFSTWRRPHLLVDYYRMHSSTPEIQNNFRRFLSALFGVSGETVENIRYMDPGNRKHFDLLPPELSARWIEGRARNGDILPGYCDPQTLFMLGEDSNTCMGIRARQKGSNRGLLSMLLHGNCRILGAKDSHGRLTARAVSRLLIDDSTSLPALYVETPYGSVDEDSYVAVYDQAAELGHLLCIPVIYASPPSSTFYVMGRREVSAVRVPVEVSSSSRISSGNLHHNHVADWMIEDDEEEEDEEDEDDNVEKLQDSIRIDEDSISTLKVAEKVILSPLVDYTEMASHVWIDGIRDPTTGRYLTGHTPFLFLTKRASGRNTGGSASVSASGTDEEVLVMGGRSQGSLEMMVADGLVLLQPAATRLPSIKKEKVEDVPKIQYTSPIIRERVSASLLSISSTVSVSESYPVIDEVDDDDDFFGSSTITVPRVRPQKSLIPVAQVAPSELQTQTAPSVVRIPESDAWALPPSEPLSAVEIEDKRKSKKHKSVSVQARLAERQRYLSEAQQRRANATSDAARSKEEQTKQYQLKKNSSPLTSASSSVPLSSSVFTGGSGKGSGSDSDSDRKNEYSLRTARTSVAGEIIRIVPTVEAEPTVQEDDDDDSDGLWA